MPWNGSGVFNRVYSWVADRDAGLDILADRMDQDTNDIAQGLMHCLTVNGETVPAANLLMNGYRVTGAASGVADSDYATVGQVKNGGGGIATGGFLPIAGGTVTGNLTVSAGLTVAGATQLQGLNCASSAVTGAMHCATGEVTGNFLVHGTSELSGAVTADGALNVTGFSQLHGVNCSNATITGPLICVDATINGIATVQGACHLNGSLGVAGTLTAATSLNVTGTSTLHALNATTGSFANAVATGPLSVSGGLTTTGTVNAGSQITAGSGIRPSADNGSSCGVSGQAWSTCASYAFQTVSDARLKRDIAPLPAAAGLVAAIEPKRFRWATPSAEDGGGLHWGFIAQEIEVAMAGAGLEFAGVRRDDTNDIASLDHSELVPVLWKAVQELSARVAALEAQG